MNEEAKRLFLTYTGGTGNIDTLYGQAKASCRAHILSVLAGERVPQRRAGMDTFQQAMCDLFEVVHISDLKIASLNWEKSHRPAAGRTSGRDARGSS